VDVMKNKAVIWIVSGVVVVIASAMTFVLVRKDAVIETQQEPRSEVQQEAKPTVAESPSTELATPGVYVSYSETAFAAAKGTRLLFFHAAWCPQCRALDASISRSALPDAVTILKVDYDSQQALRTKYGVTLQTTIVRVDADGNKVESYVAYDEPTFESVKRELL
jgi:thiol-disulfide isomerase/thioredoxin